MLYLCDEPPPQEVEITREETRIVSMPLGHTCAVPCLRPPTHWYDSSRQESLPDPRPPYGAMVIVTTTLQDRAIVIVIVIVT